MFQIIIVLGILFISLIILNLCSPSFNNYFKYVLTLIEGRRETNLYDFIILQENSDNDDKRFKLETRLRDLIKIKYSLDKKMHNVNLEIKDLSETIKNYNTKIDENKLCQEYQKLTSKESNLINTEETY